LTTDTPLSRQAIFRFYLPLAVSWLFMGLEGPVCVGVISRLPGEQVNAAAFLVMMSLAIWIESPVIDLLSTSTTLTKNRASFAIISKFTWWMMAWVTLAHGIVVFTPLYGLVTEQLLGIRHEVAAAARPGLMVMLPWSAFIGWRRYLQGILIRNGQTKAIGFGTTLRVATIAIGALGLYATTTWPSVIIASTALLLSVMVETTFVHLFSRRTIREHLHEPTDADQPLSMAKLAAFHFPLTATTMVKLIVSPVIAAGLARTPDSVLSLAAFQTAGSVIFLFRAIAFCLPEVVIALYQDEQAKVQLRRFCLTVGLAASGAMLLLSALGLDRVFLIQVLDAEPELAEVGHWVFLAMSLSPLLDAVQAYVRGVLTKHHLTLSRMVAVAVSTAVLVGMVSFGVAQRWSGPTLAGATITTSLLAEFAVLAASWVLAKPTLRSVAAR